MQLLREYQKVVPQGHLRCQKRFPKTLIVALVLIKLRCFRSITRESSLGKNTNYKKQNVPKCTSVVQSKPKVFMDV